MFDWFRRKQAPLPPAQRRKAAAQPAPPAEPPGPAPAPLPEVVAEGNTQADWSAWEDSMTALDSQLQDLPAADRVHVRDTRPSQIDDLDPFAGVGRKRR